MWIVNIIGKDLIRKDLLWQGQMEESNPTSLSIEERLKIIFFVSKQKNLGGLSTNLMLIEKDYLIYQLYRGIQISIRFIDNSLVNKAIQD